MLLEKRVPPSEEGWLKVTQDFYNLWQMPNTLGAMDGKHIRIRAPSNSGSRFYNYKKYFSTILFAVCDAKYNFIYVDIGSYGAQSDGGVFRKSSLGQKLLSGQLNLPIGCPLPNDPNNCTVPTFFIGDEAFPLLTNLLRPYSKREKRMPEDQLIFNYRLSRGRRVIENTFGIMVARFRIFLREIHAEPETVDAIVKAVVCLHNFIKSEKIDMYYNSSVVDRDTNGTIQPGSWRDMVSENTAFQSGTVRFGNRNAAKAAWKLRDYIKEYVNGVGGDLCPWQWDCIKRTE
ncbi:hypothetical protein PPYR_01073 [Photinus pyralis]|uniref:DDE Tnp4 domain-containing protein n=1 Tax=Photinus pyralis TaxID=7054 RepID=A0A5N4B3H4_PHOPY|nr:hypothetical protein PPYR_01073 [Photinus pyralis]